MLEVVKIVQIAHPKKTRARAREDAQEPARLVVLLVGPWKITQGRGLMPPSCWPRRGCEDCPGRGPGAAAVLVGVA